MENRKKIHSNLTGRAKSGNISESSRLLFGKSNQGDRSPHSLIFPVRSETDGEEIISWLALVYQSRRKMQPRTIPQHGPIAP